MKSFRETGLAPDESLEQKVNYGGLLLQALLEYWPRPYNTEDESDLEQVRTDHKKGNKQIDSDHLAGIFF